jgi:hypothetical protein
MSLFQQAAQLNNQGINALIQGDLVSAIQSMTNAIKLMKAALFDAGDCSVTSSQAHQAHTIIIPSMNYSETIVFNQLVQIPITDSVSELDMNIYISAVLFNLALAHQYLGSSVGINKAEKLYGMVLQLLDNTPLFAMRLALVVRLGRINNLSQIRYSKGDYHNAHEGLRLVTTFLRESSTGQALFEDPEIQGLLMNVLLLNAPSAASAA